MEGPTAEGSPSVESSLNVMVQALLREMKSHQSDSQKGIARWSLQKKLDVNPSWADSLIQLLVNEMHRTQKSTSKSHRTTSDTHVIPLIHTLYYALLQAGVMVHSSLYQTVYECLMKLLVLPSPHSAVALRTLWSIKMEIVTPGSLYLRKVVEEQNLTNQHFTLQEKVFVLADPVVFSVPLEETVKALLEKPSPAGCTKTMEKNVLLHVLQRGLGTMCKSSRLIQALKALENHVVDTYFQELVLAVEESIKHGAGGQKTYWAKLCDIYRAVLSASNQEKASVDPGSACNTPLPFPEINFVLWRYDKDLCDLLTDFTQRGWSTRSLDQARRESVQSTDGETKQHLKEKDGEDKGPAARNSALNRRKAFKNMKQSDRVSLMKEKMEAASGGSPMRKEGSRRFTARVVVMGDDRVLGRLSKAYYSIRKSESKCLNLTKKLNLQLYYIPVADEAASPSPPGGSQQGQGRLSLASFFGRVDPWYDSNVNSLRAVISKLAGLHSSQSKPSQQSLFLLDTLCYYLRCGTQPVNLPFYSVKMTCSRGGVTSEVEEVFVSHLEADIHEFRHFKENSSKKTASTNRKKSTTSIMLGAFISVSYTKISLSKREVTRGTPMTYGMVITSQPATETSGEDYLTVHFESLNPEHKTIQTRQISIKTMEGRSLFVCMDRDARRTYENVQSILISPCLDPGCYNWSRSSGQEMELSKYLDNVLSLPINTFTGVSL